jgi:hypothetical protein
MRFPIPDINILPLLNNSTGNTTLPQLVRHTVGINMEKSGDYIIKFIEFRRVLMPDPPVF